MFEVDEAPGGEIFIAMAFYEGETLDRVLARGPVALVRALSFAVQTGRGLSAAHDRGDGGGRSGQFREALNREGPLRAVGSRTPKDGGSRRGGPATGRGQEDTPPRHARRTMPGRECYHCKQWVEAGDAHDCWTTTEEALTEDLSDDLREAWERLRETAASLGEQRIYASHHSIMFSRRSCYAFVRPKRTSLEVCVFLGRAVQAPQVRRVTRTSRIKLAHFIRIHHRDEVEPPLTEWLREAYEVAGTAPRASTAPRPSEMARPAATASHILKRRRRQDGTSSR